MKRSRSAGSDRSRSGTPSPPKRRLLRESSPSQLNAAVAQWAAPISIQTDTKIAADAEKPATMIRTTEEEQEYWYFGMTRPELGLTELIARSSTFSFKSLRNDPTNVFTIRNNPADVFVQDREQKVMSTVKGHQIVDTYDADLRPRVREILHEAGIRWLTIDVVCLGFKHDESDHPPVVLITVDVDKVNRESAQTAVDEIHELMIRHGLPDVHAEVKSGQYSKEATYNAQDVYPPDLARVPTIGASISVAGAGLVGSIGLFLMVNGSKYALTCQHVVTESDDAAFTPTDGIEIPILQPGKDDLDREEAVLDEAIMEAELDFKNYEEEKLKFDEGKAPAITPGRKRRLSLSRKLLKECSDRKAEMAEVRLQFGVVDTVPGKTKHPLNDYLRDWALIKLSDERFADLPPNVLAPSHFSVQERAMIMKVYPKEKRTFPADVLSQPLSKVITMREIEDILKRSGLSDHQDRESLRVVKHGRTSGFAAGSLNEIRSDCYNGDFETTELVVVNIPGLNNFSFGGDSGACVVDLDGRIVGLLHHGNNQKGHPRAEMTYVTPMAWILEDIKATLKTDDVVIPANNESD